jgi:hypothetical protein
MAIIIAVLIAEAPLFFELIRGLSLLILTANFQTPVVAFGLILLVPLRVAR